MLLLAHRERRPCTKSFVMNILGMQLVVLLHRNVFPSTETEHMHLIFIVKIMV